MGSAASSAPDIEALEMSSKRQDPLASRTSAAEAPPPDTEALEVSSTEVLILEIRLVQPPEYDIYFREILTFKTI